MDIKTHTSKTVRAASTITFLAAIWLFISPWVYAAYRLPQAWNSWSIGFVIAVLAAIRIGVPEGTSWISWLNCLFGAWTFASPWIFRYTSDTGRFVNSLCIGAIIFIMAVRSATATPRTGTPQPTGA